MDKYIFEETIKAHLKRAGLSQAAVARKLDFTPEQFNKWVRSVNHIPDFAIQEFSNLLGLSDEERRELFTLAGYVAVDQLDNPVDQPFQKSDFTEHLSNTLNKLMLPLDPPAEGKFHFFGIKEQGMRINLVALIKANDSISKKEISSLFDSFYLAIQPSSIANQVSGNLRLKNGIWGILCFIFENGCHEELINFICRQRKSDISPLKLPGVTVVCWVIDVKASEMTTHWWFPAPLSTSSDVFFPGKDYFEAFLHAWNSHNENS
jgi:hypothetical protein